MVLEQAIAKFTIFNVFTLIAISKITANYYFVIIVVIETFCGVFTFLSSKLALFMGLKIKFLTAPLAYSIFLTKF